MAQRFEPIFDMYGAAPPVGDWAYVVDDFGIGYGPGWWPFYRDGKPGTVRVAPEVEYRAWRNEYILFSPGQAATATARLQLFVRAQGMGAMTVAARIGIDIRHASVSLPDALPAYLRELAIAKGQRLLDLVLSARADRRRGSTRPRTAADRASQTPPVDPLPPSAGTRGTHFASI